ncbi:MAG: cytochrome b [Caulobacteraceae bacterium]
MRRTAAALPAPDYLSESSRYRAIAIFLHWLIALAIIAQVCIGWWMNEVLPDHSPAQAQLLSIHISLGLSIFMAVILRILARLAFPAPPLPAGIAFPERFLARASHLLFYCLMLALPLSGWTIVSSRKAPILFWGIPSPRLPGVTDLLSSPAMKPERRELTHVHVYIFIWILVGTFILHVAGALYHQFGAPRVLWRMVPGMRPAVSPRDGFAVPAGRASRPAPAAAPPLEVDPRDVGG